MKRAIPTLAILLAILLALAACGGGGDTSPDASVSASDTGGNPSPSASEQPSPEETPDTSAAPETPAAPEKPVPEQTSFKLGHLNSTAHLLGFVAAEEGFFKDEGLDTELLLFASAGEMVAGLESGNLDAAFIGSVPTITFQSQDHPVSVFGGAMTNGHGYVIKPELLPEGFVQGDITVLRGRNVASVKNSVQDLELQVLLTKAGLTFNQDSGNDVNIVYFESQKDAFNALAGAEIDAASVYSPYASIAKNQGYAVIYYCNEIEEFLNQPCCRQVALTEALESKPATYTAFERAIIRAYKFSQENREKTIADVKAYIDIDAADIEYEVYGGHAVSHPDPDKKATVALKEGVVDFGYTTDYDIEPLYNVVIYESALNSLIVESPGDAIYAELLTHFNENDA
jgi:NitT/TauT family transport system substrate-binding protein